MRKVIRLKFPRLCSCSNVSVLLVCVLLHYSSYGQVTPQELIKGVDDAVLARENNLAGFTVTERYSVLRNGEKDPVAEAIVETVYKKGKGKTYTVKERTGSSFLQKYLIDRVLSGEREISLDGQRQKFLITSANYKMDFLREESLMRRSCFVFRLTPISESPYLLDGRAWVDSHNYHLVRLEGRTSAKPSFWAGHPLIQRDYQELGGFELATRARSESKNIFLGTTILTIDYENYNILTQ